MMKYGMQAMIGLVWLLCAVLALADEPAQDLNTLSTQLVSAGFKEKAEIAGQMAALDDERVLPLLNAMLDGKLNYRKDNEQLVIVADDDSLAYALSSDPVGDLDKRDTKKISVNNSLRIALRALISEAQISSRHADVRMDAALTFLKNSQEVAPDLVLAAHKKETDGDVKNVLTQVLALIDLNDADAEKRLGALTALDGSLYPEVRAGLNQFIQAFSDDDKISRKAEYEQAQNVLKDIEKLVSVNGYIENLYFGLALGAVLLLAAIGLAITFGVMGVINMAHGEMIMLGAYTTYVVQQLMPEHIGLSLVVSIPAAFLVSGAVGVAIERGVIRHLYGRPLETLLATFGISLILQQAVRSIFSPLNREVATPDWMAGTFMINPALELTWNRLYIIIFSLMVLALLALVLKRTLFGLQMRAVTMNRPMASSMGIRTGWVDALTFGLGSGIAGIAGVALSQLTNVGPNLGQAYIIDSFMVVVFGGVGNLWGTLVAAMSLGVANKIFEPLAGAVLAKIFVLVFIILFIQKRPRGLFALKGRAVENA
ncbi:urea ABC transporter permease subunit UrtB [Thalassolituus sp. LLYu03]|uniref:urea ABC transporter permease subunit UrtB n=1 Tax=Thalassolituus sp. LLYu03 TaxID=3421656 RepID=UPI003D26A407